MREFSSNKKWYERGTWDQWWGELDLVKRTWICAREFQFLLVVGQVHIISSCMRLCTRKYVRVDFSIIRITYYYNPAMTTHFSFLALYYNQHGPACVDWDHDCFEEHYETWFVSWGLINYFSQKYQISTKWRRAKGFLHDCQCQVFLLYQWNFQGKKSYEIHPQNRLSYHMEK
jgi:hypothetical protein